MSSSDIIVGYNKNDFFYVNAETKSGALTATNCTMNVGLHDPIWDVSCNATNFVDNSANCMVKELCINKEYANKIKSMQQNHSGADEQYENAKQVYDQTFAHTLNLGSGILVLLLLMYKITTR
jgi:hypothetical protein